MLSTMSCDICKKKFLVRPSKYNLGYYKYDLISFSRINTGSLNIGGDTYRLNVCPGCFADVVKLIASTYDLDGMKTQIEHWENQVKRHEQ